MNYMISYSEIKKHLEIPIPQIEITKINTNKKRIFFFN